MSEELLRMMEAEINRLRAENAELRRKLNKWDEDLRHLDAQVDEERERTKGQEREVAELREMLDRDMGPDADAIRKRADRILVRRLTGRPPIDDPDAETLQLIELDVPVLCAVFSLQQADAQAKSGDQEEE